MRCADAFSAEVVIFLSMLYSFRRRHTRRLSSYFHVATRRIISTTRRRPRRESKSRGEKGDREWASSHAKFIFMGSRVKTTILIHFADDRRRTRWIVRARDKQRVRVMENRRARCVDEDSVESGMQRCSWVTRDSTSCLFRRNSRNRVFLSFPSRRFSRTLYYLAVSSPSSSLAPRIHQNFLTLAFREHNDVSSRNFAIGEIFIIIIVEARKYFSLSEY